MHKKIVLKTDASYKNDMGVGIAYEAIVYDHGAYDRYTGSKYIPKQVKTTDAEMAAAIFGLKETYKKIDEHHPQYELVLRSDCEHVVLKINEGLPDKEKMRRSLEFYTHRFRDFKAMWIPRANNTKADSLARQSLENGWEER